MRSNREIQGLLTMYFFRTYSSIPCSLRLASLWIIGSNSLKAVTIAWLHLRAKCVSNNVNEALLTAQSIINSPAVNCITRQSSKLDTASFCSFSSLLLTLTGTILRRIWNKEHCYNCLEFHLFYIYWKGFCTKTCFYIRCQMSLSNML